MRVVTFYTSDELYSGHFHEMAASLAKWHPERTLFAEVVEPREWVETCSRKAEFCGRMLWRYPHGRMLWMDVDARVRAPLTALEEHPADFDLGCHYTRNGKELLSGTLLFEPTEASRALCSDWSARCSADPRRWDQRHLADAVKAMGGDLRVWDFGVQYVFIHDTHRRMHPGVEPVIEHLQASREARKRQRRVDRTR